MENFKQIKDDRYMGSMPFIELIEIGGFSGAIFGMRNPLSSWYKGDSYTDSNGLFVLGENDKKLAKSLIKSGSEHRKFLRQIYVQFNINISRYIYSELDTYKVGGTTCCSTSTMHKLLNKDDEIRPLTELDEILNTQGKINRKNFFYAKEDDVFMFETIERLNQIREQFLNTKDPQEKKHLRRRAKMLLPESYLQFRTYYMNYETLMNIYNQRKAHNLDREWTMICKFIEELPYMKEFLGLEED